jgi:hypothetical protein
MSKLPLLEQDELALLRHNSRNPAMMHALRMRHPFIH